LVGNFDKEDDGKEHKDEPKKTTKSKDEGISCIKEDDDEENSEVEIEIDLKKKLVVALVEIISLKNENEELKMQVQNVDHNLLLF